MPGVEKKPTGASTAPVATRSGFTTPPEVLKSQRQIITTTTVGTIQVSTIQVRATRTPGKRWCRASAVTSASTVWSAAFVTTQRRLSQAADQNAASPRTAR